MSDPDPAELPQLMEKFIARVNLLFVKGEVLHMKHSFTAQMLKFLEKPSVVLVKRFAVLFAKPTGQDAKFEPLQRMRAIAGNVVACLRAALPDSVWQVQFSSFFLPSPLGAARPGRPAAKALMRNRFLRICTEAKHNNPEASLEETLQLLPCAEKHSKEGILVVARAPGMSKGC